MGLLMWRDHAADESYFPSYDLNGNLTGLLDDSGDYVAWYEYDGFGKLLLEAALFPDVEVVQACTLVAVAVAVLSQIISDVGYTFLNPRIRFA